MKTAKNETYNDILKEYLSLQKIQTLPDTEYDYEDDYERPYENCVRGVKKLLKSAGTEYHCLHCSSIFPEALLKKDFLGNMQGCPRCDAAGFGVDIRHVQGESSDFVAGILLQNCVSPDEARQSGYDGIPIEWAQKKKIWNEIWPAPPEDPNDVIKKFFNLKDAEIEEHEIEPNDLEITYEIMDSIEDISSESKRLETLGQLRAPEIILKGEADRLNNKIADFRKTVPLILKRVTEKEISAMSKLIDIYLEKEKRHNWTQFSRERQNLKTIKELYEAAVSSDNYKNEIFFKGFRLHGSAFSRQ